MRRKFEFNEKTIIAEEAHSKSEFLSFLQELDLKPPFIVKPNWICEDYGHFTDPQILRWTIEFLRSKGHVALVESYSARNMTKCPTMNPSLKFTEQELKQVRSTEEDFLKRTGMYETLQEFEIEYVNVAEEVLKHNIVDPNLVKKHVISRFDAVSRSELYSFVPKRLYSLRDGTFVNLAKFKVFFSICTKNLFGLIPEHVGYGARFTYHGKADQDLSRNIVDVNKVYRALFNVVGLVEGITSLTCDPQYSNKKCKSVFGYEYGVLEDLGLIYYSDEPLWLDAFIYQQCGRNPSEKEHLALAASTFGTWPFELLDNARKMPNPLEMSVNLKRGYLEQNKP